MHLWTMLWALWMVGLVVLNVSRLRRSVRRRGRCRGGTTYGSSYDGGLIGTTDFSSTPSDSGGSWWSGSDGGSSWGGCDSGSSWGGSDSGSSSSDSGSSCF